MQFMGFCETGKNAVEDDIFPSSFLATVEHIEMQVPKMDTKTTVAIAGH